MKMLVATLLPAMPPVADTNGIEGNELPELGETVGLVEMETGVSGAIPSPVVVVVVATPGAAGTKPPPPGAGEELSVSVGTS
jgi:hypothetical protein